MSSTANATFLQLQQENQTIQMISAEDVRFFKIKELQRKIDALSSNALSASERNRLRQDISMTEGQLQMAIGPEQFDALKTVDQTMDELKILLAPEGGGSLSKTQSAADRLEKALGKLKYFHNPTAVNCLKEARNRIADTLGTKPQAIKVPEVPSFVQQTITPPRPITIPSTPETPAFSAGTAQKNIPVANVVPEKTISLRTDQQTTWGGSEIDDAPIPLLKVDRPPLEPESVILSESQTVEESEMEVAATAEPDDSEASQDSDHNYLLFLLSSFIFGAFGVNFFLIRRFGLGLVFLIFTLVGGGKTTFFCYSASLFLAFATTRDGKGKCLAIDSDPGTKTIRKCLLVAAIIGLLLALARLKLLPH